MPAEPHHLLNGVQPAAAKRETAPEVVIGPGFAAGRWRQLSDLQETLAVSAEETPLRAHWNALADFAGRIPPGGAIAGFVGYEMVHGLEPQLPLLRAPDGLPRLWAGRFGCDEAFEVGPSVPASGLSATPLSVSGADAPAFQNVVNVTIDRILAGDIFQANISRRLSAEFSAPLKETAAGLFAKLLAQKSLPAYTAYFDLREAALISASPELFLQVDGPHVLAEPIKGTRPRGMTQEADRALVDDLVHSAKDRAENIMIVDLLRNDLAKVCRDHSIEEPAICALRTLPNVHHLYSQIRGVLREDLGPIDALAAAFPCGSITGAPKMRAMEVISELEGEGRGPYCGSVFYIPDGGPAVFSVAIRTATLTPIAKGTRLDYRTGGGITVLSDPSAEFQETEDKAYLFRHLTA